MRNKECNLDPEYKFKANRIKAARSLLQEVREVNENVLYLIGFRAVLASDTSKMPCIVLKDLQRTKSGDLDQEQFYSADEVIRRMSGYLADTFLDGEICCGIPHNFKNYEEAEGAARTAGYIEEADAIHYIRKYLKKEE